MLHHKLLESQIKKFLPEGSETNTDLQSFINAINETYINADKEKELLNKGYDLSSETCAEIKQLLNEKEAREALKKSEEKYRNIIEKSTDIIYKTNREGIFTFVNPVAERITGFSKDELLSKHFSELIREDYQKMTNSIYRKQIKFKKATTYLEFPIVTKTGKEVWIGQSVQYTGLEGSDFELTALAIDITDKKNSEKIILLREEKYRNIIANINMGLVEVDTHEIIRYCNQGFCDLSGYTKEELIGKNIIHVLVHESEHAMLKTKTEQRSKGIADMYEIQIKNKKGELRWWMVSGAPNFDDAGNLIGSIGIHLDITQKKILEQELKISKQKAEESSKAKEAFLANMSHEIRTPLNAIIGMIRELSHESLTETQKVYVQNTSTASQHLLSVLNNILDISKIEAGEFNLEARDFNFESVLDEVTTIMKKSASDKHLFLDTHISKNVKQYFIGDPTRLRQIILNLVGNAIKFTEKGGISIHCDLEHETGTDQTLLLSIHDTGIGMENNYLKNIFTKFSQEDISTSRKYGGTGLGMAITYELIQLMNGSIDVQSEKNRGTTITIRLSLKTAETLQAKDKNHSLLPGKLSSINVLLVEDNEFNQLVATKTLNRNNCKVTPAVNGSEAIEKIKSGTFDVILMDLQMPVLDGIEATKIIRNELHITTPIIALSANAFKTESDLCLAIGMNDYVTKPFEEKILMNCILKNIEEKKGTVEVKTLHPDATSLYDMSGMIAISDDDPEYLTELVKLFVRQTSGAFERINEALKVKDLRTISEMAHSIKPGIDSFNILGLKAEIREIESIAKEGIPTERLDELIAYANTIIHRVNQSLLDEYLGTGRALSA